MNILVSSAGRRVGLINCFRQTLAELGLDGRIIAVDAIASSPAGQLADSFYIVPKCVESDFLTTIEQLCEREEIGLIVPTIDTELPIYAAARSYFKKLKVQIAISSSETIAISGDKQLTHDWLRKHGFPTPRQATPNEVLKCRAEWTPPLLVKPPQGSASTGVRTIASFDELEAVTRYGQSLIVQEFINGAEYTTNVFVDRNGKSLCAVPHRRIEIRAGEVSKGVTERKSELIRLSQAIVEALPGAYGPLNIQGFVSVDQEIKIIEVNARFGGGYPLTHQAGAPMTRWLVEETLGWAAQGPFDAWQDGLMMLRYDEAVFVKPETGLKAQNIDSLLSESIPLIRSTSGGIR